MSKPEWFDPAAVAAAHDKMTAGLRERVRDLKGGRLQMRCAETIGRAAAVLIAEFRNEDIDHKDAAIALGMAAGNLLRLLEANFECSCVMPTFFRGLEKIATSEGKMAGKVQVLPIEGGTA